MATPGGLDANEHNAAVAQVAAELVRAIEITMDPTVPHPQRLEAYNHCEAFKDKSPYCVQCGLYLAQQKQLSEHVQHFGLQLMEYCIKYRWYDLPQGEKIFIKENAMKLLSEGMSFSSPNHMKDALSRIVVEMVKREWPQQWPGLMTELSHISSLGESQTVLVLLVFLRLVEDVHTLQTLESNQRRKDLYQALTMNLGEIFNFFTRLIESHMNKYRELTAQGSRPEDIVPHCSVVQTVLLTLTGFLEWVPVTHVMADEGRLLQDLCLLLDQKDFQCGAADCLLLIVGRKGKPEDRKPFMVLFGNDVMACMFRSACSSSPTDEAGYKYLKLLAQVLTGLGLLLCGVWGKDEGASAQPSSFSTFLEIILSFTRHPSLTLTHTVSQLWGALFRHEAISRQPIMLEFIPKWVEAAAPKAVKVAYPSVRSTVITADSSYYAGLDYDSKEEFNMFNSQLRIIICENFRQATFIAPLITYGYVERWLQQRIQQSISDPTPLTLSSPAYQEWAALAVIMDSVLSKILQVAERPSPAAGLRLLEQCLSFEPTDPLVLSELLSCVSALFVFLSMAPSTHLLTSVLNKIFAALVFSQPGVRRELLSRDIKSVRRHGACLMVKIGTKYPLILLPIFDQIYGIVSNFSNKPELLSSLEKVTLQESLLLINNHFYEYERQTKFIGDELKGPFAIWHSLAQEAFGSPLALMNAIGLCQPLSDTSNEEKWGVNRSNIMTCINLMVAVVKRCTWPDDPDKAARGGFVVHMTKSGNPVYRNPAAPHVIPMLPNFFALLRVLNALWTPEALARLPEDYKLVYNITDIERAQLLGSGSGAPSPDPDLLDSACTTTNGSSPLSGPRAPSRMQSYVCAMHDNSYHMLGSMGVSFGWDLYQLPELASNLVNTVFHGLEFIPDYRLRPIVRNFLKPFIGACPSVFYESAVLPVLANICPYMFGRLSNKWQYLAELREAGQIDDENTETQEVVDDMLNRNLTRDYLDVLKVALIGGTSVVELTSNDNVDGMDQEEGRPPPPTQTTEVISELGQMILRCPLTSQSVALCVLRALSWPDTGTSYKAAMLTAPMVRQLLADGSVSSMVAAHIMTSVLQGLQFHGHHDVNQSVLLQLGTQVYDMLRPRFVEVVEVMKQIPGINLMELQKLDEKVLAGAAAAAAAGPTGGRTTNSKTEKAKKDNFKRLTTQLINCSLSQLFCKKAWIAELPRLDVPRRAKPARVEDLPGDTGLAGLFHGNTS